MCRYRYRYLWREVGEPGGNPVPYAEGGVYADADSHLMEPGDWLIEYADPDLRDRLRPLRLGAAGRDAAEAVRSAVQRRHSATLTDEVEGEVMKAKGWHALGAFDAADRSRALDLLGFESQLVFSTFAGNPVRRRRRHPALRGHRAPQPTMVDFCAQDRRLVPVGFVPWGVPELTVAAVQEAIRLGCGAVLFRRDRRGRLPTHPDYHGVWAALADADVPFMLHVGGGGRGLHPAFRCNGKPPTTDFLGGGENIRAKDYMVIAMAPETFLSCLILDGILDEFPRLRGGCIEQGAMWVVPWLRRLDLAQASFQKTEPALRLPLRASEYVHRQLQFTPFPTEPVGWLIEQSGDDLFLFSSDYPHPEGGRDPLARFEASLEGTDDEAKHRFYAGNYADLLGSNAVLAPSVAASSGPGHDTPGPRHERTAETAQSRWGARSGGALNRHRGMMRKVGTACLAALVFGISAATLGTLGSLVGAATPSRSGGQQGGGNVTFGLEAETNDYCLTRAQLRELRHPSRQLDLRDAHRAQRQGRGRAIPR